MASKTRGKAAGFTLKLYGRLKRLARDKCSSFPRLFIRNEKNEINTRISSRLPGTGTSSSASGPSFPCSPAKMFVSPQKRPQPSPRKLVFSPRKLAIFNSPTSHLPNMVLDEVSSPGSASKSTGKKRQRLDWLTTLSHQKKQQCTPEQGSSSKRISDPPRSSPRTVRAKRKLWDISWQVSFKHEELFVNLKTYLCLNFYILENAYLTIESF